MAIYTQSTVTANTKLVYCLRDHLGSLQYVVNEAGTTVLEEYSYDAWGCRRDPVTWKPAAITANTARGFTGHEHIDLFELVNMDGRVYDPRLGRFMSADLHVQKLFNTQSYNRYSYCLNRPIKFTDPSGYFFKELFGAIGAVVALPGLIGSAVFMGPEDAWKQYTGTVGSFADAGKGIDNSIFGKRSTSNVTGQPGFTGSFTTCTVNGTNVYKFNNLKDMANFMWTESEKANKEVAGYVLVDENGKEYYYVFDCSGNNDENSDNPKLTTVPDKPGVFKYDNKYLKAQVHTHPSSFYMRKRGDTKGYDGNSYKDYMFAYNNNVPVYSIGPNTVSVITRTSPYNTEADFNKIASGTYSNPLSADRNVNPFAIMDRESWLNNPFLYKYWW